MEMISRILNKLVPIRLCSIALPDIAKIQNIINSWGYTNLTVEKNETGELILNGKGISDLQRDRILVNSQICAGLLPVSAWRDRLVQHGSEYIDLGAP